MRLSLATRRWSGLLQASLFAWLSVVSGWSPCAGPEMAGHGGAGSAVSDTRTAAAPTAADPSAVGGHAMHGHHATPGQPSDAAAGHPVPHHAPSPAPGTAPGTACPMAMACAPVGLAGDAITMLAIATVPVDRRLEVVSDRAPDSTRRAPEPPPPRA